MAARGEAQAAAVPPPLCVAGNNGCPTGRAASSEGVERRGRRGRKGTRARERLVTMEVPVWVTMATTRKVPLLLGGGGGIP